MFNPIGIYLSIICFIVLYLDASDEWRIYRNKKAMLKTLRYYVLVALGIITLLI